MNYIQQMNENNITKEQIKEILVLQNNTYLHALENIMSEKNHYKENVINYDSEMFTLAKIIKINRRAGYKYAVIRDEVLLKSYQLLTSQNKMIENILNALNNSTSAEFHDELVKYITKNKLYINNSIGDTYKGILELKKESKTLKQAQKNIRELYALVEINEDMMSHIFIYETKMYRLNKYATYHIIDIVLFVNNINFVKVVNPILENYNLNVIKIIIIIFLISLIYFIRKVLYITFESYIKGIKSIRKYSIGILKTIRKPINFLIITINVNMVVFVYNDFASIESSNKFFNIIYVMIFTLLLYKIMNTIAKIKIYEIDAKENNIKNEIINVGLKIANFIIFVIGILVSLHFSGADLSTVLSGLGIGGFAVALAAKDSLANFFGTLSILLSDVFSQGDWIVIDGKEGVVVEIGLRVTTLRTFDNALIAIPNATLANQDVKNWNKRTLGRRIKMSLGIKYDSKSIDIKNAIEEIRIMLDKHPRIATENTKHNYDAIKTAKLVSKDDLEGVKKTLLVYLDEFSDSSINILIYCFTKSTDWNEWLETKEDVMHRIMEIFEKNNLEFAFPSMSLYNEQ